MDILKAGIDERRLLVRVSFEDNIKYLYIVYIKIVILLDFPNLKEKKKDNFIFFFEYARAVCMKQKGKLNEDFITISNIFCFWKIFKKLGQINL